MGDKKINNMDLITWQIKRKFRNFLKKVIWLKTIWSIIKDQDKLDKLVEEEIRSLEKKYEHNQYLMERAVSLFMIRMEKKYGVLEEGTFHLYIREKNPWYEKVVEEGRKLLRESKKKTKKGKQKKDEHLIF